MEYFAGLDVSVKDTTRFAETSISGRDGCTHDRFGSIASVEPCPRHVGSSSNSGRIVATQRNDAKAISTGRCNTLVKSLCWRLEVQRFPGPLVELACHLVQLGLGVPRKIKAPGEVLAQQAIGVFA